MESINQKKVYQLVLNGSTLIEVPQSTLTKVEGSSLEAMFSGRHDIENKDGLVHLNRDPAIFQLVVDYLHDFKAPDFISIVQKEAFEDEMLHWGLAEEDLLEFENKFQGWPDGLDESELNLWQKLGPFQLGQFVRDDKIELDYDLEFKKKSEGGWKYEGQINSSYQRHGVGRYWNYCQIYEGMFENGQFSGFGRLVYSTAQYYEGFFLNGKKEGKGRRVMKDGKVQEGNFFNGEFRIEPSTAALPKNGQKAEKVKPGLTRKNWDKMKIPQKFEMIYQIQMSQFKQQKEQKKAQLAASKKLVTPPLNNSQPKTTSQKQHQEQQAMRQIRKNAAKGQAVFVYGLLRPEDTFGITKSKKFWKDMAMCEAVVRDYGLYIDEYPAAVRKEGKKVVGYLLSTNQFSYWKNQLALYDKTLGYDPEEESKDSDNIYKRIQVMATIKEHIQSSDAIQPSLKKNDGIVTNEYIVEVFMYVKSKEHLESESLQEVESGDWSKQIKGQLVPSCKRLL